MNIALLSSHSHLTSCCGPFPCALGSPAGSPPCVWSVWALSWWSADRLPSLWEEKQQRSHYDVDAGSMEQRGTAGIMAQSKAPTRAGRPLAALGGGEAGFGSSAPSSAQTDPRALRGYDGTGQWRRGRRHPGLVRVHPEIQKCKNIKRGHDDKREWYTSSSNLPFSRIFSSIKLFFCSFCIFYNIIKHADLVTHTHTYREKQ